LPGELSFCLVALTQQKRILVRRVTPRGWAQAQ
jgi:hypothetical protein